MCYSARLVVWFAKKGEKKVYIRLVLFLMLLLCVFILYLQGHYSFLVPQQRWFTTCRSGCLCRRMNKSLWEKFTCIGYRTIWIYLFTLHLLLSASWSSHHLLHRMQMHCRKVWSEQRRTWFAYTFATRRPTVYMYMEIIQEDKEKSPACRPGLWKGQTDEYLTLLPAFTLRHRTNVDRNKA